MMAQFVGFSPDVEVNGETVYAIVDGMGTFRSVAFSILAENGIEDPRPGVWFPQQRWLNAFKKIAEKLGDNTLYNIGLKIPSNAQFPKEIESIHDALRSIDVAYHINHRNGDIGEYFYQKNGEHSVKMFCRNPYPCAFDRGIIAAMANRYKPKGVRMIYVKHDDHSPCRVTGAESCTYNVTW